MDEKAKLNNKQGYITEECIHFKVSVIIPVYRVEKYIERCVRHLMEQTLREIEYIFVDDCSPDDSMMILFRTLEDYPDRSKNVRIVSHSVNQGLAAARDVGTEVATGEYISHCDSDDWPERTMYEDMYLRAKEVDADIVCCNYYLEYSGNRKKVEYDYAEESKDLIEYNFPNTLNSAVWNKLVRKQLYVDNDIHWFKGINMNEDVGVTLRLRILSKKTVIVPRPLYHYNRQNLKSMIMEINLSYVEEQIECARQLSKWLHDRNYVEYYSMMEYYKFWSKSSLFTYYEIQNIERWRNTFPETNSLVWRHKSIKLYHRIPMWLTLHGFPLLGRFFIWLKYLALPLKRYLLH